MEVHKIKFDYSRVIFFKQINRRKLKLQNRGKPLSPQWIKKKYITTVTIYSLLINWLIAWFLLNVKWIIFQLFSWEKQVYGQSISLKRGTGEWDQYRGVGMNLKRTTSFKGVPESGERGQETFKTDQQNKKEKYKKVIFIQSRPFYTPTFGCYHAIMICTTDFSKKKSK